VPIIHSTAYLQQTKQLVVGFSQQKHRRAALCLKQLLLSAHLAADCAFTCVLFHVLGKTPCLPDTAGITMRQAFWSAQASLERYATRSWAHASRLHSSQLLCTWHRSLCCIHMQELPKACAWNSGHPEFLRASGNTILCENPCKAECL
jgi:hypothetical protein